MSFNKAPLDRLEKETARSVSSKHAASVASQGSQSSRQLSRAEQDERQAITDAITNTSMAMATSPAICSIPTGSPQMPAACSTYQNKFRNPVILVEGKVRKRCEKVEREIMAGKEELVNLQAKLEAHRHSHTRDVEEILKDTKNTQNLIAEKKQRIQVVTVERDRQTKSIAETLAAYEKADLRRQNLEQRLVTREATILTLRSSLEAVNNELAALEESCIKQHDVSAENDVEQISEIDKVKARKLSLELDLTRLKECAQVEIKQLKDVVARAQESVQSCRAIADAERKDLNQRQGMHYQALEKLKKSNNIKIENLRNEKVILNAKLEKICNLNAKMEERLAKHGVFQSQVTDH